MTGFVILAACLALANAAIGQIDEACVIWLAVIILSMSTGARSELWGGFLKGYYGARKSPVRERRVEDVHSRASDADGIRAMRLRLRRLGRDDGAFSDSDVLGLIKAVDAFLAHGELCRVALGDGRQIEITWRTQIVTTDHKARGNGR
ncbi:hypothetical protein SAMN04488061_2855 [Filomicrobium insigne]|uniref:Uncharacterized protein n=1 Tax=Filomicrobium insigne TaxID=418854 RepID=A0A1H0SE19_9HYPH|nr:hypothetical protein [Filomicrobium insigne]SDP39937.1 hypothetical protein SAMN04488061_2855 [Filomicrobium insigne]